jgi:CBS domain-containing protein
VILLSHSEERIGESATLRVEDVMVKDVIKINEDVTIKEAAGLMNKYEIGCLIAVKKGKVSGILTERDLLKRVVAESKDASKLRVRDVMTSPLIVAEAKMDLVKL